MAHGRELGASLNAVNSEIDKENQEKVTKPRNSTGSPSKEPSKKPPKEGEKNKMGTEMTEPRLSNSLPYHPLFSMSNEGASGVTGTVPIPDDLSVPPEVIVQTKEVLKDLHTLHLRALFKMGSVWSVDQILAEQVMAQFAPINLLMGEDLNISLQELVTNIQEACKSLHQDIWLALGPTLFKMCGSDVQAVVDKYHQQIDSTITRSLLFLDCAWREGHTILKEQVSVMESTEELQELSVALSEWLGNHQRQVWNVVMGPEMADPRVISWVNAALAAVQPMVNNYFRGILGGLMGFLSLTASPGEETAHSTQEGVERRVAEALNKCIPTTTPQEGYIPWGLHVGYKQDFLERDTEPMVPALSSTALPDLLMAMDRLHLKVSSIPNISWQLLTSEVLFDKVGPGPKETEDEDTGVHLLSQSLNIYDKAPKVKGVKNYSTLPNRASKEEVFKIPRGVSKLPGEMSHPGPQPPLISDQKGLTPKQQSIPVGKVHQESSDAKSCKRKILTLQENVAKKLKESPKTVEGVTIEHDSDSSILATLSISGGKGSSKATQSLCEEDTDQGDPSHKVQMVIFSSNEEFGSPKAKSKSNILEPPNPQLNGNIKGGEDKEGLKDDEDTREEDEPDDNEDEEDDPDDDNEDNGSSSDEGKEEISILESPNIHVGSGEDPNLVKNHLQKRITL